MFRLRLRWTVLLSWAVLAALHPSPGQGQTTGCTPADTRLCLQGFRFAVEVAWEIPGGGSGRGHAVPLTGDTGSFWFFDNSNVELVIKVLDGRASNGHFWIYYGALSDVAYTITVTDTDTGEQEVYPNLPGRIVSRADTSAFAPEAPGIPNGDNTALAASPLLRRGPEFQSNATFQGDQRRPSVAVGPDGGFMVVWAGQTSRNSPLDVFGRFYGPTGQPLTGEVRLHAEPEGDQAHARVAASPTGEYMAVWLDGPRLVGRVFGPDGTPLGGELRIGFEAAIIQATPSITADPAGGFLVAWRSVPLFPSDSQLRWQRFNNRGQRVGVELGFSRAADLPVVAASPDGGFVLAWREYAEIFGSDIQALRLDETGAPRDSEALRVNIDAVRHAGSPTNLTPLFHPDGGFSIVWATSVFPPFPGSAGIHARRYDALGQPVTPVVAIRPGVQGITANPAAVALPSGESLVVWFEQGLIPDLDGGLYGQLFDSSWSPLGGESRVNTFTTDLQTDPALAVNGDGDIVAAWSSGVEDPGILTPPGFGLGTQDGDHLGVFGQRFTLASCALDPTTQLCLGGRFRVEVQFTDPRTGERGTARAIPLTSDTGAFWFFDDTNVELVLKVLDGRGYNGRFWIYYGALSDVRYRVTVTDTLTDRRKTYNNPRGTLASRADIEAF